MTVTHRLFIDWDKNGDWSDPSEEVSNDLLPVLTGERGKDQARIFAPPMAGDFSVELNNESHTYNPYAIGESGPLLLEDGTTLLLEDGSELLLEGSVLDLEPGKLVRWTVNDVPVWTGISEDMSFALRPQSVRVSALGILSKYNERKVTSPVYQGLRTDQALHVLFDALGHPVADRDFSTGDSVLDWFWLYEANPIQTVNDILNTEGAGASFYEDGQGRLIFENRNYRTENTRASQSQYTFSTIETVTDFAFHPDYHDITNQCFIDIAHREAQALQEIWALGEELILAASETKTFTIRTSDPFINATVPSAVPSDAVQSLAPSATLSSGTFKLRYQGATTTAINYNASAATIQAALEALSTIGSGNVSCDGGPINTNAVLVSFIASLGGRDIPDLIETIESTLNPVNVGATIEVDEITSGDDPLFVETQRMAASGILTAGTFTIFVSYSGGSGTTSSLAYTATAGQVQTALRAISGFGATNCFGGPISTASIRMTFVNVNEAMDEAIIVGTGLMTLAPSATIAVSQSSKGGVPDYVLTGGGLLVSKTISPTSGQEATLELVAGSLGATLTGLRVRAQPVTVVRSETVQNDNDTSASITTYGERPYSPGIRQEISRETALAVANSFTTYYPNSRPSVTIRTVSAFDDMLDQQLYRRVSDRITIEEPSLGLNGAFWIEQIRHTGDINLLYTEFGCEKALHGDSHADSHSDTAHTDSAAHADSHTDTAHSDTAHTDSHSDAGTHSDTAHSDTAHTDSAHSDVAHTDVHTDDYTDSHTDDLHSDDHSDTHTDTAHADAAHSDTAHSDTAHSDGHTDTHSDDHGDTFDPPFHLDDHTDIYTDDHTDTLHSDTAHTDTSHADSAHSDTHSDVAHSDVAHGDSHTDTGESNHSDEAHSDVAHGDVAHSDVAHSDDAHSDSHSDVAHVDNAHTDSHSDTAHSDTAHSDTHSDTHSDEA